MPTKYTDDGRVKRPGKKVEFDAEKLSEYAKCIQDIIYFAEKYYYIVHPLTGAQKIKLRDYQLRILDSFMKNRMNVLLASRQIGKTTVSAIYMLWFCCFQKDKTVAIVANKAATAKGILEEIKFAYENLPEFLKPGVIEYNAFTINFDNGCKIIGRATSADCLRGESVSLLFCLSGDSKITIRNNETKEICDISLEELYNNSGGSFDDGFIQNDGYEVLTPSGWSDFKGVLKSGEKTVYKLTLENGVDVKASGQHEFFTLVGSKKVEELIPGMVLETKDGGKRLVQKEEVGVEVCYDLVETDQHRYYVNSLATKNCDEFAFVPQNIAHPFWTSNFPTISTGGRCVIVSTPNGTGNLFYDIWKDALDQVSPFAPVKVDWWEVPGRDDKWRQETEQAIGAIKFAQEYGNQFQGSSVTLIEAKFIIEKLRKRDPEFVPDEYTKMWKTPVTNHIYTISVDLAAGVGSDYTVINVFDVTGIIDGMSAEQVAIWRSNVVPPTKIGEYIFNSANYWNGAYVIVEINPGGYGDDVVKELLEKYDYENIYFDIERAEYGVMSSRKSKPKAAQLFKKDLEGGRILLFDNQTINEIGYFEEVGENIFKAKQGKGLYDDCVMTCLWFAYFINSEYFEGEIYDLKQKRLKANGSEAAWYQPKSVQNTQPPRDELVTTPTDDGDYEAEESWNNFLENDAEEHDPDGWLLNSEIQDYKKKRHI